MLQGSLENFALDEVLGLLASTSKSGQLEITGDRGTGSLTFSDGRLVDGTASHTANGTEVEDVMFELLRYADGTFTFTSRDIAGGDQAQNVASVLSAADHRLQDWRQIEAVVPTLSHQVAPADDLPTDEVTISRDEWAVITTIAAGCPASLVCDQLSLGEVEGSRRIKNLAERQLVTIADPLGGFSAVARGTSRPARQSEASTAPASEANPVVAALAGLESTDGDTSIIGSLEDDSVSDGLLSVDALTNGTNGTDGSGDATDAVSSDRPPMPPIPTPDELVDNGSFGTPPAPPSPEEISSFSEKVDDISDLVDGAEESKSGLLARYRKNDE